MVSVKRLSLIILPAVLMLVVAACGDDDPTATSAPPPPADEATATPVPDDTPPPAEPPPPPPEEEEEPVIPCADPCLEFDTFSVEDGKFEFRLGDDGDLGLDGQQLHPNGIFGYPAFARVPSIIPGGIVMGPFLVGTTFRFNTIRMSGSRSTKDHYFIIRGLASNCREGVDEPCVEGPDVIYEFSLDGSRTCQPCDFLFDTAGTYPVTSATAEGDDSPEEHGMAAFLVCDEIAEDGKSCVGGGEAAAFDGTYVLGDFIVEDGKFVLEMGETPYWGYTALQAIPTIPSLNEIVIGPIQVGEILSFERCRQSGSRSPVNIHHMTIDALGIDYNLDDGRRGSDPPGGTIGEPDEGVTCDIGPFTAAGEYLIYDSTDPDGHGVAKIIVEGEAMAAEATVYTINEFNLEDGLMELRLAATPYWGYEAGARLKSNEAELVITVNVGDSIVLEDGFNVSSSRSSSDRHFTITELGIDILGPVGERDIMPGFTIEMTTAGTFSIHDSGDPGVVPITLIVQ